MESSVRGGGVFLLHNINAMENNIPLRGLRGNNILNLKNLFEKFKDKYKYELFKKLKYLIQKKCHILGNFKSFRSQPKKLVRISHFFKISPIL